MSGSPTSDKIPTVNIDISQWKFPLGIKVAAFEFYKPATVDLLIGAETFFEILPDGRFQSNRLPVLSEHSVILHTIWKFALFLCSEL